MMRAAAVSLVLVLVILTAVGFLWFKGARSADPAGAGGTQLVHIPTLEDAAELDPLIAELIDSTIARVRRSPDDPQIWHTLGIVYHAHFLLDPARQCYEKAIELDPAMGETWYQLALVHQRLGDYDEAVRVIDEAAQRSPEYLPADWRKGMWLTELGRFDEAQQSLQRAAESAPNDPAPQAGLALLDLQRNRAEHAVARLEPTVAAHPENRYLARLLGTAYQRVGRTQDATPLLAIPSNAPPKWDDPWSSKRTQHRTGYPIVIQRAQALIEAGRPADALTELEKIRQTHADDPRTLNMLAHAHSNLNRVDRAIDLYERSLAVDSGQFKPHLNLSYRYEAKNELNRAIQHIRRAIDIEPDSHESLTQLGRLLIKTRAFEEAAATMQRAIDNGATRPENYVVLGQLLDARLNRTDEAVTIFETVLAQYPQQASAYIGLGFAHARRGNAAEARLAYDAAKAINPNLPVLPLLDEQIRRIE